MAGSAANTVRGCCAIICHQSGSVVSMSRALADLVSHPPCVHAASASGNGGDTSLTNVVPGSCFIGNTTTLLNIAFAFGFSIFAMVYAAASFSGEALVRLCRLHTKPPITIELHSTGQADFIRLTDWLLHVSSKAPRACCCARAPCMSCCAKAPCMCCCAKASAHMVCVPS